jgi:murein DD-endopeptidase MepM/ murein hydrolase activator NlpD
MLAASPITISQSWQATSDTLKRGETIGDLFARQGLNSLDVGRLKDLGLDARRLRAGLVFNFRRATGSEEPSRVEVRTGPEERVRLEREEADTGWDLERETILWTHETVRVAGFIGSSLYAALDSAVPDEILEAGERMKLAWDLADVYAWSVDFTRDLQAGDRFAAVIERRVSPEGEIRYGRVLAASLELSGKTQTAFRFAQDGREGFYDAGGVSLRRAFLAAPVEFRRISSRFSRARFHPILRTYRMHAGIDYAGRSRHAGDGRGRRHGRDRGLVGWLRPHGGDPAPKRRDDTLRPPAGAGAGRFSRGQGLAGRDHRLRRDRPGSRRPRTCTTSSASTARRRTRGASGSKKGRPLRPPSGPPSRSSATGTRACSSSPLAAGFLPPTDTSAMMLALVLIAAVALAAVAYAGLERLGRRALLPMSLRAIAWASLGVLLLNPGCPVPPEQSRPIVLLDGSLSMRAAGGRFDEALADARGAGEVRLFGDPEARLDSVPLAGRSLLAPALAAARASGRPVIVVTDGELADSLESLPLLTGVGVRLFERKAGAAVAIASVRGAARITERDTLRLSADIHASGIAGRVASAITVRAGEKVIGSAPVAIGDGLSTVEIAIPGRTLGAGEHALTIALRDSLDLERRDDRRLQLVTVSATPGVALVASPGDWESRFLYRVLRDVTDLPVEGFVELVRGQWKRMSNLQPVDGAEVRQAVSRADLAILRGATDLLPLARGALLEWPSPSGPEDASGGDWYLAAADGPPAGALAGAPVDSFAPMTALSRSPSRGPPGPASPRRQDGGARSGLRWSVR